MPSGHEIETCLRNAVKAYYEDPSDDPPTVNSIRGAAIAKLDLDEDYFKRTPWKAQSKHIIQEQFELSNKQEEKRRQEREDEERRQSLKRAKSASPRPRKKSRVEQLQKDDDEESTELSTPPDTDEETSEVSVKPKKVVRKGKDKPVKAQSKKPQARPKKGPIESDLSDVEDEIDEVQVPPQKVQQDDDTSSELSSVIDEPVPKRKSKAKNIDSKPTSSKPAKSTPKLSADTDPNMEEIKRLQGWLVRCGVRKVWGKELKPFETSKAKIGHLKQMLADVGMTGRYSNEKAAQIKEARELAADIEAVQEGNERWGKNSDEEQEADDGRPKRRLVRGAQNYDFLSSGGEETD